MLLLNCRTPISGSDHALKISMSNQSTWTTDWSPIESKIKKKIKWYAASRVENLHLGMRSHFENFYVEP